MSHSMFVCDKDNILILESLILVFPVQKFTIRTKDIL